MNKALSPEHRPYDPSQLQQMVEHMRTHGNVISAHDAPMAPNVVHEASFEHYPEVIEQGRTALSGLRKFLTFEGRVERTQAKIDTLKRTANVARFIGERITNPRTESAVDYADILSEPDPVVRRDRLAETIRWVGGPQKGAGEKIGWVGTSKPSISARSVPLGYEGDFAKIPDWLLKQSRGSSTPNTLRPVTLTEHAIDRRLEASIEEARRHGRDSRWLSKSYGNLLNRGTFTLSRAEQKNMRKTSKQIAKDDWKQEDAMRIFNQVASGRDIDAIVNRLRSKLERIQRNQQRWESVKSGGKKTVKASGRGIKRGVSAAGRGSVKVVRDSAKLGWEGAKLTGRGVRASKEFYQRKLAETPEAYRHGLSGADRSNGLIQRVIDKQARKAGKRSAKNREEAAKQMRGWGGGI